MQIDLANHSELMIRQRVERLEAFTGFETANRYTVMTPQGEELLYAHEESGTLSRILLKGHRPLTLHIGDRSGNDQLVANRSFFWFFSHLHVKDPQGRHLGSLRRRFSFPSRKMTVEGPGGQPVAEIRGPLFKPKTFMIYPAGTRDRPGHEAVERPVEGGVHRRRHLQARTSQPGTGSGTWPP